MFQENLSFNVASSLSGSKFCVHEAEMHFFVGDGGLHKAFVVFTPVIFSSRGLRPSCLIALVQNCTRFFSCIY